MLRSDPGSKHYGCIPFLRDQLNLIHDFYQCNISKHQKLSDLLFDYPGSDLDFADPGSVDLAGFDLMGKADFFTGCQVKPISDDGQLEQEYNSAKEKVGAGTAYIMLPPVFDIEYYAKMFR